MISDDQPIADEYIELLINKIDKLSEKLDSVISLNQDLIKTNLHLSGKFGNSDSDREEQSTKVKNLFYFEKDGSTIIHGNGTFDKRTEIKNIGGVWNKDMKAWEVYSDLDLIKTAFPGIKSKNI